uniref:DNA repair protein RAD51 4 n=2 Tax=Anthurium amnicola TaxID=1678845 RepID=A0A1D1Z4W9_9ARAE
MPPLKSLEQEFPMIDSNFRRFCASHGIFSVEDFLVNDLYVLTASAEREPISEALKQGMAQVLSVVDRQHQPWLNGMDLLGDAWRNKRVLPTGCQGVDLLLQGGLREGLLVELVGPSSSGKTQVCLHAAAHIVERLPGTVMFLDSGNSFSAERISCILDLSSTSTSLVNESKERRCHRVLSSISCQSVFDIFELLDVLHQLDITLRHQVKNEVTKLRLLIIDSISSLITPILGGKDSHGRSLMISAGSALKRLAFNHNLSVLVTNHMVGGEGGISKPALGESWKSIPHVRLLLSRDHGSDLCIVSVLKHSSMALGCTAKFVI